MTTRLSSVPRFVSSRKWPPSRRMRRTSVSKRNSQPLAAAFSASAMVMPKGQIMALVGAYSAAAASGDTRGS